MWPSPAEIICIRCSSFGNSTQASSREREFLESVGLRPREIQDEGFHQPAHSSRSSCSKISFWQSRATRASPHHPKLEPRVKTGDWPSLVMGPLRTQSEGPSWLWGPRRHPCRTWSAIWRARDSGHHSRVFSCSLIRSHASSFVEVEKVVRKQQSFDSPSAVARSIT